MEYTQKFKEIFDSLGNIENKSEVALGVLQEIGKDTRVSEMIRAGRINPKFEDNEGDEATQKQIALLSRLGANPGKKISKREASKMIEELTGRK